MAKVKICGITNTADARAAVEAGADALGFIFYAKSSRCVTTLQAKRIIEKLPPFIATIGVFVDEEFGALLDAARTVGLSAVQLHGVETPEFCTLIHGVRVIKAARVRGIADIEALGAYDVSAYLLDAYSPDAHGGTGLKCDWSVAAEGVATLKRPVILAGGLTPENVAEAVRAVRPYAVDVASGVEASPGIKDHEKVRAFIANARKVIEIG